MDLQALDDLIAVADSNSLTEAAQRRNVTQPAFTRRLQAIEKALGIQVTRHGSKPTRASDALLQNIDEIRGLADALRRLKSDLSQTGNAERVLTIASLHAIALAYLPSVLNNLNKILPLSRVRLRAANRDECYAWLMTGQVRIMMLYETDRLQQQFSSELVERATLCTERMIPVCAPSAYPDLANWSKSMSMSIPLVGYPDTGVLGNVLRDEILPKSNGRFALMAATEFTSAVLELCERGLGVAWVPELLAEDKLARGSVVALTNKETFPIADMKVSMLRVHAVDHGFTDAAWKAIIRLFKESTHLRH